MVYHSVPLPPLPAGAPARVAAAGGGAAAEDAEGLLTGCLGR